MNDPCILVVDGVALAARVVREREEAAEFLSRSRNARIGYQLELDAAKAAREAREVAKASGLAGGFAALSGVAL